jgi:uncharacterized protein (TIGR02301 family)
MKGPVPRLFLLGLGLAMFAGASLAVTPVAQAQFFWSPWFQEQPKARAKPRVRPRPPGDDLPPIVPKESAAPPPPDDRPYDDKLLRLAEVLGAVHYLRELCGAEEGQLWRNQMKDILKNEGSTAVRRAKLVNSFNNGYRGYRRTYRTCTSSATLAITRFSTEGAQIAVALAKPSHYASRNAPASSTTPENAAGEAAPAPDAAAGQASPAPPPADDEAGPIVNQPAPPPSQEEAGTDATSQTEEPRQEPRRSRRAQRARPAEAPAAPLVFPGSRGSPQISR